jgi:steroid delta-isomerase-like uncharacterized protein
MSTDKNKAFTRRYNKEIWNDGNLRAADELVSPDILFLSPTGKVEGLEVFKKYVAGIHATFPDIRFSTEQVIAESDEVVLHWTMIGTHTKEFMGIPPSNNQFTVSGTSILSFRDGKVTKAMLFWDRLDLVQQLGASLAPTKSA